MIHQGMLTLARTIPSATHKSKASQAAVLQVVTQGQAFPNLWHHHFPTGPPRSQWKGRVGDSSRPGLEHAFFTSILNPGYPHSTNPAERRSVCPGGKRNMVMSHVIFPLPQIFSTYTIDICLAFHSCLPGIFEWCLIHSWLEKADEWPLLLPSYK